MEIQSDSGPFVARPISVPIQMAKLKKPIFCEPILYGGRANAWLWVRFRARKTLAGQDTRKDASWTIGKSMSFHGVRKLVMMFRRLWLSVCHSLYCCLEGYPRRSHGSASAVVVCLREGFSI